MKDYFKERSELEREYSKKLELLSKKYLPKNYEIQETKSFRQAWQRLLVQGLQESQSHLHLSDSMNLFQQQELKSVLQKREKTKKQLMQFVSQYFTAKREIHDNVEKARKKYMYHCDLVVNAKSKYEKAAEDKREKLRQLWHQEILDMNNSKNIYLLSVLTYNSLAKRFQKADVLEIKKIVQEFGSSLNESLSTMLMPLEESHKKMHDALSYYCAQTLEQLKQVDKMQDTFNSTKTGQESLLSFIPCGLWKDEPQFVNDEFSLVFMHNKLLGLYKRQEELTKEHDKIVQSIFGLQKLLLSYQSNPLLGDPDEVKASMNIANQSHLRETTCAHDFKPQSFAIPTPHFKCHTKCEQKTPSTCTGVKSLSEKPPVDVPNVSSTTLIDPPLERLSLDETMGTLRKAIALYEYKATHSEELTIQEGDTLLAHTRDDGSGWTTVKNKEGKWGIVPTSYISFGQKKMASGLVMYSYDKTAKNEISVVAGETVTILETDDGSGWTKVFILM
ncbi:hypothetical protein EDD86DRAFT_262160 [Gorgonomyces haynaldii]|nr:hypothetical protein EDD86DRAFT_262160 [Gorgonomyces haynaldii]